jgi:radical SAM superfamily enzyme YgiQ (UPF0313 family)
VGKIGLIDVDGRNFPNLALMKISAYHKSMNDSVEWVTVDNYDRTYMSKIFSFSADHEHGLSNYGEIIKGGTGYNMSVLPDYIDKLCPDYSIYPRFKEAYGFLTRGCPNKCEWCIVPTKEGNIKPYADIEEFLNGRKAAILMDNNVLASEHGLKQLEKIAKMRLPVDFNQGLDARIIAKNESIAELLGKIKWYKPLRMACDTMSQLQYVEKATELLRKHQANPKRYFIYVLVKNVQDALERVEYLKKIGLDPFAQPYRDFNLNTVDPEAKRFARWVNRKQIFRTVSYADYH